MGKLNRMGLKLPTPNRNKTNFAIYSMQRSVLLKTKVHLKNTEPVVFKREQGSRDQMLTYLISCNFKWLRESRRTETYTSCYVASKAYLLGNVGYCCKKQKVFGKGRCQ